jgi:coenzyme Q-binding protein COQ10
MPHFRMSRRVAVPPETAFAVASDVGSYASFLPLLESAMIRGPVVEEGRVKRFSADLVVGYAKLGLRERFISKVSCDASSLTVTATSQDPPFKSMLTTWTIRESHGQSDVSVEIDYAMRSLLLQFALVGAMDMAVSRIFTAFEARAAALHKQSITS